VPFSSFPGCDWLLNGRQRTAPCGTALLKNSITYSCALRRQIYHFNIALAAKTCARTPLPAEYEMCFVFPNQPQFFLIIFQRTQNTHLMFVGELSLATMRRSAEKRVILLILSLSLSAAHFFLLRNKSFACVVTLSFRAELFQRQRAPSFCSFSISQLRVPHLPTAGLCFFAINIYLWKRGQRVRWVAQNGDIYCRGTDGKWQGRIRNPLIWYARTFSAAVACIRYKRSSEMRIPLLMRCSIHCRRQRKGLF
jgi:hypothetical protein